MKKFSILALGLFFIFEGAHLSASAQFRTQRRQDQDVYQRDNQRGRQQNGQVCVFQNSNYTGWQQCYSAGDEISDLMGYRNNISSIRITGPVAVTVFDNKGFSGQSDTFTSDVPDLVLRNVSGNRSWNDRIESLRVTADNGYSRSNGPFSRNSGGVFGNSQYPQRGVCVFDRAGYQGRMECFQAGDDVADLARLSGWNDKVSSIRVFGNARVVAFENAQFGGERLVIDRDIPDLNQLRMSRNKTWNDKISALQVDNGRGFGSARANDRNNSDRGRVRIN